MHASAPHPGDGSRAAFKAAAVRQLREWGWRPVAGLGDRPSDLEAYAGEGLAALMLTHAVGAPAGAPVGAAQRLLTAEAALSGRSGSGGGGGGGGGDGDGGGGGGGDGDGGGATPCVLHFSDCAAARALPGMRAAPPRALPGAARERAGGALFTGARLGVPLWEQVEEALEGLGLQ